MDNGAHFHRCDFQVHTPRDINWIGKRPADDNERKDYADAFIAACRKRRLDAVAITDHHDFAYFPFIHNAAKHETTENGGEIPDAEKIVVFPGLELTLGVPCQALLLLDPEFPIEFLSSIYPILGVVQNKPSEPIHTGVQRLEQFHTLNQLRERFDESDFMRGHYILLPNVSEGGGATILRKGFSSQYKDMPCVGGYVDGDISQWGKGILTIVEGKNREYGFKSIGVFQTSDNRKADFADLGLHSTWVKWAEPTAEAVRQACLARQTRISVSPPAEPSILIRAIDVSNSKFMGPFRVEFNSQLNAIIGGRGTGKSTILEYLRWALGDQPPGSPGDSELPDFQARRQGLIQNTLVPVDGVVTLELELNRVPHIVRRGSKTGELSLKIGDAEFTQCSESDVNELMPIQAFSQKQLSGVSVREDELRRFITAPIQQELSDIETEMRDARSRIRTSYSAVNSKRQIQEDLKHAELEIESLSKQLQAFRKGLKGLSESDRAVLEAHDAITFEEETSEGWTREIDLIRHTLEDFSNCLEEIPSPIESEYELPHQAMFNKMETGFSSAIQAITSHVEAIESILMGKSGPLVEIHELQKEWRAISRKHSKEYEGAKERSAAQKEHLQQIAKTEERLRATKREVAEKRASLKKMRSPEKQYELERKALTDLIKKRGALFVKQSGYLTQLSGGQIRSSIHRYAGVNLIHRHLTQICVGTRIRSEKIETLCARISDSSDPLDTWERILKELESLALLGAEDEIDESDGDYSLLQSMRFTSRELTRLIQKLSIEEWVELSLVDIHDLTGFEYRQREGDFIPFADASAGQQATALLQVLLNQEGPPLVIDQPEEDIDNKIIPEIVQEIWKAKGRRQVVFSSHNANIVVNGDADLVICCDYRAAGDQSGGRISAQGAIDMESIRKIITEVMEGGRDAFELRREKYGF